MLASHLLAILPLLSTALAFPNLRIRDHGTSGGSDAVPSGIPGSIAPAVPEGDKPLDVVALYGAEPEAMAPAAEAPPAHEAPAEGGDAPSATTILHTTTYTGASPYYTPQYGSGAWQSGGDLNSCLSMCHAQFGGGGGEAAPPAAGGEAKPPAEGGAPAEGGKPPGTPTEGGSPAATHTIIVAPTMGVLRYVPFAVTAAEGDTLHFIWGAGPHSVTLSDGNNVCNKSTTALAFDSGKLNATQTFETVVKNNASTPQFHYCTVGPHCSKGMFGLINPPTTNISNELTDKATKSLTAPKEESTSGGGQSIGCSDDTVACWAEKWGNTGNSKPEAKAVYQGVKQKCQSVPAAWEWGSKWDFSKHTSTVITKEVIIENIMYSRLMFASNPSMLDKSKPYPTNYISPPELNSFIAAAGNSTSGAGASAPAGPESPSPTVDSEAANATTTTGAAGRSLGLSPAVLVALVGLSISIFI